MLPCPRKTKLVTSAQLLITEGPNVHPSSPWKITAQQSWTFKWAGTKKVSGQFVWVTVYSLYWQTPITYVKSSSFGVSQVRWLSELDMFDPSIHYHPVKVQWGCWCLKQTSSLSWLIIRELHRWLGSISTAIFLCLSFIGSNFGWFPDPSGHQGGSSVNCSVLEEGVSV